MKLDIVNATRSPEDGQFDTLPPRPLIEPQGLPENADFAQLLAHSDTENTGEDHPDPGTHLKKPLPPEDDGHRDALASESVQDPPLDRQPTDRETQPKKPLPPEDDGHRDALASESVQGPPLDRQPKESLREAAVGTTPAQAPKAPRTIDDSHRTRATLLPLSDKTEEFDVPFLNTSDYTRTVPGDSTPDRGGEDGDRQHDSSVASNSEGQVEATKSLPVRISEMSGEEAPRIVVQQAEDGVETSTNAGDTSEQDNPMSTPVTTHSLGEEILAGMNSRLASASSEKETLAQTRLVRLARDVAAQILVANSGSHGALEVRVVLKQSVLPDTEVVLFRTGSELMVRFVSRSEESSQLLMLHQRMMQDEISRNLNCSVLVNVSAEHQDGRSRGQRDIYAEIEEDDS